MLMEPECSYTVVDSLIRGVLVAAVQSEKPRPGLWKGMMCALARGTVMSESKSASAFLFKVMTDRVLEEFHAIEQQKEGLS